MTWLTTLGMPRKLAALLVVVGRHRRDRAAGDLRQQPGRVGRRRPVQAGHRRDRPDPGLAAHRARCTSPTRRSATALDRAQEQISALGEDAVGKVTEVGTAVGHVVAGLFIVLFATYFFLADGAKIWAWLVRLFPRAGRLRADSSGRVAWQSLTQFVRATVLVAATDAIGIMIGAAILGVPFVSAIGVLVFLGAFVPMIGAFVSGTVAVLVALVAQGPFTALLMFGVVVARAAARGARAAAVPDGPLRLRAPARRDRRHRAGRDRGRHPRCPDRRTAGGVAQRRRAAPRELHRGR